MKQLEMLKKAMAGKGLPYGWTYCFNEQCHIVSDCNPLSNYVYKKSKTND